jgi:hypothetical protein
MLFLRYYLWVAPHLLLGTILVIAWRRGWHRRLPFFFCFAIFEVLQFSCLFSLNEAVSVSLVPSLSIKVYQWIFVSGLSITSLLQLGVLFELGRELLLSRKILTNSLRLLMNWTLGFLLLVAAATTASFAALSPQRAFRIIEVVDFSSSLIQVGLLLVLFLFSRALRISWHSWTTGIALGFGIAACINLAAAVLRATLGNSIFIAIDVTDMAAFHTSTLIWLIYLFLPNRSAIFGGQGLGASDIQFWDQELQRMARQ